MDKRVHYKMYKAGKFWTFAAITITASGALWMAGHQVVADANQHSTRTAVQAESRLGDQLLTRKAEGKQAMSVLQSKKSGVTASKPEETNVDLVGEGERTTLFNDNWKVQVGDTDGARPDLDDSKWQVLDLPHDYSITQAFDEKNEAESGFLGGGVAWYRKTFTVAKKYDGKRIMMNFDGAYMNATVYVNGQKVAEHPNGYAPFSVDLTDYLKYDGVTQNLIAVKTNNQVPSSRWYSGSGIYRDVKMTVTDAVHVDHDGVTVTTPKLAEQHQGQTDVHVQTVVRNDSDKASDVTVQQQLLDDQGKVVATVADKGQTIAAGASKTVTQVMKASDLKLWSPDNPTLYTVRTKVMAGDEVLDQYDTDYGFRYFAFDRETGFTLNGKQLKLKGVSMHHDQGALGAVANQAAINRQVRILKEMGCNAIRSTHNPASQALINACNRYGMLMIDEGFDDWSNYKNGNSGDYAQHFNQLVGADNHIVGGRADQTWAEFDVKSMVNSGKNAPAVIMWSIGNEITEGAGGDFSQYPAIAANLIKWIKSVDDSRLVTIGDNQLGNGTLDQINDLITKAGGIVGKNYKTPTQLEGERKKHPDWKLYGSETSSAIHSRGEYSTTGKDNQKLQMSEYENADTRVGWGHTASDAWKYVIENDWNAGEFVWTGFDYIGEPTPWNGIGTGSASGQGAAPKSSYFGIVDTAGFPKDIYYLYRSIWNKDSHTLNLMSTWNGDEIAKDKDGNVRVDVYTDAAEVELFLNGKSLGKQKATDHETAAGYHYQTFGNGSFYPTYNVKWQAGELTAKAWDKGGHEITQQAVGRKRVKTAGASSQLWATVDRKTIDANGRDLAYVEVDVLDKDGNPVPDAKDRVQFGLKGNGKIVGVDNGDPTDLDSYKADNRRAFHGKSLVIVQSTKDAGDFTLTASGKGLTSTSVTVKTTPAKTDGKVFLKSYTTSKRYYMRPDAKLELPKTITGNYSDGTTKDLAVTWDKDDLAAIKDTGEYTVHGTVAGEDLQLTVTVNVVSPVAALVNTATKVEVGKKPHLPATVASLDANGEIGDTYDVKWQAADLDTSKTGTYTVKGTADVLGDEMTVNAKVTVVPSLGTATNIARDKADMPVLTNGYRDAAGKVVEKGTTSISDNLVSLNDGVTKNQEDTDARWTNWGLKDQDPVADSFVQLDWQQEHTIGNAKLYHFTDNQAAVLPGDNNVRFEYWDATAKKWVEVESSHITQVSYLDGDTPYGFKKPVTTTKLRVWMKAPAKGQCIGLTEAEVFNYVAPLELSKTAALASLTANSTAIKLVAGQQEYTVDVKGALTLKAEAKDNGAVTVAKVAGNKYVVVVAAEDGKTLSRYVVTNTGEDGSVPGEKPDSKPDSKPDPKPDPKPDSEPNPTPKPENKPQDEVPASGHIAAPKSTDVTIYDAAGKAVGTLQRGVDYVYTAKATIDGHVVFKIGANQYVRKSAVVKLGKRDGSQGVATIRNKAAAKFNGDGVKIAGAKLKSGTKWKVFYKQRINGVLYYNLGGDQFVRAEAVNFAEAGKPVPFRATGTIKYAKNYSIQVWTQDHKLVKNPNGTNKKLMHGTSWKVFSKMTINGTLHYNVGGNQWVEAQYVKVK